MNRTNIKDTSFDAYIKCMIYMEEYYWKNEKNSILIHDRQCKAKCIIWPQGQCKIEHRKPCSDQYVYYILLNTICLRPNVMTPLVLRRVNKLLHITMNLIGQCVSHTSFWTASWSNFLRIPAFQSNHKPLSSSYTFLKWFAKRFSYNTCFLRELWSNLLLLLVSSWNREWICVLHPLL